MCVCVFMLSCFLANLVRYIKERSSKMSKSKCFYDSFLWQHGNEFAFVLQASWKRKEINE